MKKMFVKAGIAFLTIAVVWGIGPLAFVAFLAFMCAGEIRVSKHGSIPRLEPRMYILSNHPNVCGVMLETVFVPAVLFIQAIMHPLKNAPLILIDRANFTSKPIFYWLRMITISITRGKGKTSMFREIREIKEALSRGRIVMSFGAGRDCTGTEFWHSASGKNYIRKPTDSLGILLSCIPDIKLVLVWVGAEGAVLKPKQPLFAWPWLSKKQMTVAFSEVINSNDFLGQDPYEITKRIAAMHLALADRTTQG